LVKRYVVRNVHQLLLITRFFVFTKFRMPNGGHMDARRTCDLKVVHLFKSFLTEGLALLNAVDPAPP